MDFLSERQQKFLEVVHNLGVARDKQFAMWIRVPITRSWRAWAVLGLLAVSIALIAATQAATWTLGLGLLALLAVPAGRDRNLLSWGEDGSMLHRPARGKFDGGVSATVEVSDADPKAIVVNGEPYGGTIDDIATMKQLLGRVRVD